MFKEAKAVSRPTVISPEEEEVFAEVGGFVVVVRVLPTGITYFVGVVGKDLSL